MLKKLFFILLLLPFAASAQTSGLLTYQQAVELALKNNYDIQIAKNIATIADVQNNSGNAGFLPRVDVNASGSLANNNTHQEFSNGLSVNKSGVASNNTSAGVYLSWTLFDGMKMFATKERLNILEQEGELSLKIQIENTLEEVTLLYYQIVKQEQLMKGINAALNVSEERVKLAERKSALGSGSNVELLQAKLDLNAQKSDLIAQKNILNEYKSQLLILTKSTPETSFSVDSSFVFDSIPSIEEIKQNIVKSNNTMLFAQKDVLASNQNIKEIRSQTMPKLSFISNYVFGRTENEAGFALLNQNAGFNTGLSLSWNVFNGAITQNQLKVASLQSQNASLQAEETKEMLFSNAEMAYQHWQGDKEMLTLEEENIKLAEQSLNIALERLKLGLGNYLEIKESQNSYEEAVTRLVNARYNLKQSETTLKRLSGALLK